MRFSRREFVLGGLSLPALRGATPAAQPNVALILVDNLPSWVLTCYGNKDFHTPNIARIAQTGVRMLNHYSASPAPGPGRASLLTGRTARQLKGAETVPEGAATLDKILGGIGYARGSANGATPDVSAAALKFFDAQSAGKPFFFEAWFRGLTPPYEPVPANFVSMYAAALFESAFPSEPPPANTRQGREMMTNLLISLRKLGANLSFLDEQIGALRAKLVERRLLDHTIIALTSTCGALYGRHGLWGSSDASEPHNLYQETASTPMIWSWPRRLPPQTTRPENTGGCDFLPTVCELAYAPAPAQVTCGRSYAPLISGKPLPKKQTWRNVTFSHIQNSDLVRDTRFKLIERDGGKGPGELYDLQNDPRERNNVYEDPQFTTVRTGLTAELAKWRQTCAS